MVTGKQSQKRIFTFILYLPAVCFGDTTCLQYTYIYFFEHKRPFTWKVKPWLTPDAAALRHVRQCKRNHWLEWCKLGFNGIKTDSKTQINIIFLNIFLSVSLFCQQRRSLSLKRPHKVQASEFSSINIDARRCSTGCFLSPLYLVQRINEWPMKHRSRSKRFEAGPARKHVTNLLRSSFLQLKFKTF